ncbi:MAG TPA: DNA repair protein RecO [Pseudogracilibacillus sp.]|nr:DNA repair protein RecO [Pseudogracilibacillus sp.]
MLKELDGIVLKSRDYGETHKIITMYTKQIGKMTALCRGANKAKSRLSAVSQPFIYGEFFTYLSGKGLSTVQQATVKQSYRSIREDIIKTAYAAYIVELLEINAGDRERDVFIFDQLTQTLQWINDKEDYFIPVMMFELKMFKKGGFLPVIDACVRCNQTEGLQAFSVFEGGLLCANCRHTDPHARTIAPALVKMLPILAHVPIERVGNISVKQENIQLLRQLLDEYYDRYGSYRLKSKRFLQQMDKFSL